MYNSIVNDVKSEVQFIEEIKLTTLKPFFHYIRPNSSSTSNHEKRERPYSTKR
jgi:hypothetical protein